jgi:predicted membrane protein
MEPRERIHAGVLPGIILVAIGALFFLHNLHIFYIRDWLRFWPAILVAAGIVKLVDGPTNSARTAGGVLMGVGGVLLAQTLGYLDGLSLGDLWPLALIGLGVLLLFQRSFEWTGSRGDRVINKRKINDATVFGGASRKSVTDNFEGGTISSVFGGFELDLRKANMAGDSVVLNIDAVFGGVEIRIPENWSVVLSGTGVFGGYSDETEHPREGTPGYKELIIKGSAVFGGVVIKN